MSSNDGRDRLVRYKAQFDTTLTHLNNAGLAPVSAKARDTVKAWADRFYREGYFCDDAYAAEVERTRGSLATLLGASSRQIAFFTSTSLAICQVAFGLDLKPGDEVITYDHEYGSNLYPWREACARSGSKLVALSPDATGNVSLRALTRAFTPKTRVVGVSWVQFTNGAMLPLRELAAACRERGILLVVDVVQGVGIHPLEFAAWGIDAVCGGSHKWLAAPVGAGYLAVTDALRAKLKPLLVGAQTFGSCDDPTSAVCVLKSDATRFEPGAKASIEIIAMGAAIDLILETGVSVIGAEAARLATKLRHGLVTRGYRVVCPNDGAIVTFAGTTESALKANTEIYERLRAAKIYAVLRGGGVRLSPHGFNRDDDIERALGELG